MKKIFFYSTVLLSIGLNFLFSSCGNNDAAKTEVQNEVKKITIPGVYYWEGKTDIGYGLEVIKKITMTINENGTATSKEVVVEPKEIKNINLQWYKMKDGDICFGNFETNKPDDNSPGAQFIATVSAEGLSIIGSNKFYKKIK